MHSTTISTCTHIINDSVKHPAPASNHDTMCRKLKVSTKRTFQHFRPHAHGRLVIVCKENTDF